MFCDEPILKVFKLELKEALQPKWCNSLLQITHKFEYHTTYGLWYLFETKYHSTVSKGRLSVKQEEMQNEIRN
jgi:hypothetical protein